MTKRVHWNGDMANEPKSGTAVISNGLYLITWDDGSKMVAPDFTILAKCGWTVSDV